MNKTLLKNYAKLIVRVGANVQKGQDVIIYAGVNNAYFAELVVAEAYKAKARTVTVEWQNDVISKLKWKNEKEQVLSEMPKWVLEKWQHKVDTLPVSIYIEDSDPDALNGIDQEKMTKVRMKTGPVIMKYREQMDNKYQWCIVGIPGEAWAKKIFPNESKKNAINKLWDAILTTTRVYGNPVENWRLHNKNIKDKCNYLNNLEIKELHYEASNGTNFTVGLDKTALFAGGSDTTLRGVEYNPNMPTEECFTSPNKKTANGVVYSSKPLSVMGKVVVDFGFRFKDGKIVEVLAKEKEHKEILEKLISLDEGASMLGEVALVPFDSPVNQTGLLFFNTLYDENACCHLAIGRAFNECIKGYQNMSDEEIAKVDLNKSMIHVDFMIGTADLKITATTYNGKEVVIFKDGTWA